MVNHGPSRGCITCRLRRKKCDESRPSCLRCTNSHRPCGGYDTSHTIPSPVSLRQRSSLNPPWPPPSLFATARRCSIPYREPVPGTTDVFPKDRIPLETSHEDSDILALRCFVYDFCSVSANSHLSRGYLSGLDALSHRFHTRSDIAKACRTVALAGHGKTLNRPALVRRAEVHYRELLASLAKAIQARPSMDDPEQTVITMALGLCQIYLADELNTSEHSAHARGLAVFLTRGCLEGNQLINNSLRPFAELDRRVASRLLSAPSLGTGSDSMYELIIELHTLWNRYEMSSLPEQLELIRMQCLELDHRYSHWAESRDQFFQPIVVGQVHRIGQSGQTVGRWPGRVETYFDFYVSAAWNVFRTARLLLVALVLRLSDDLGQGSSCAEFEAVGQCTANNLASSIPYHLAENLQDYLRHSKTDPCIQEPGKFLGGLLIMHPLYIASQMEFLSQDLRDYFRSCLGWIGMQMGVGQATLLSKVGQGHKMEDSGLSWTQQANGNQ